MSLKKIELAEEKEYLRNTINIIDEKIKESNIIVSQKNESAENMKSYIWDNKSDMDASELQFNLDSVNMDIFVANEEQKHIMNLSKSLYSPYFARVDFKDESDILKVYIGITGVMKNNNIYVYDWRSPIATLFYNYEIGKSQYDSPSGVIAGETILKRQYKIKNKKIERCFNCNVNINDDYLQEVLSSSSSSKMKNIVDTIQIEQNSIIRNENDKVLVVQGVAGSGKTSVAMHRIAYLLYKEKMHSTNCLIFSPNKIFTEYISNVLPELGENNVLQTTFSDFAKNYLKEYNIEDLSSFLEKSYKNGLGEDEKREIKIKLSNYFCIQLANYMNDYHKNFGINSDLVLNNEITISKFEINRLLSNNLVNMTIQEKIDYIVHNVCDTYGISFSRYSKKLKQIIIREINTSLDYIEIYNDFLKKIGSKSINPQANKCINYEDIAPLLYILFSLNGSPYSINIKQVVIDEAQDYNFLQFKLIKNIFKNAKFTILGDINQTINPYFDYKSLKDLVEIFPTLKYTELNKTYRSSGEIIAYTNKILGIDNVCSIRHKTNNKVESKYSENEQLLKDIEQSIKNMEENKCKKIAVITKSCEEADYIYNILRHNIKDISKITDSNGKCLKSITIIPSFLAKGLEFDGVIVYTDKYNQYTEEEARLFYVACTRAQHMLHVYNQNLR